jgi:YgiT-type zinc finger domain-containing protein
MKCPFCGKGILNRVDDILSEVGGLTFVERGHRCPVCGEEFIDEQETQRTIRVARRLGISGKPLKWHRRLSKSGRGVILRIPADLRRSMELKGTEGVSLSKVGKTRVVLELEARSS